MGLDHLARLEIVIQDGTNGVHAHNFDAGVLLFEVATYARNGSAGAHAAHEGVYPSRCLLPDFRASGAIMCLRVGRVMVLVRQNRVGSLTRHLLGDAVIAAWVLRRDVGRCHNDASAKSAQLVYFLNRLLIGQHKYKLVAFDGGRDSPPHPRTACSHPTATAP